VTDLLPATLGWRPLTAVAVLLVLLAWEMGRPFFALFAHTAERVRHGVLNLMLGALNILVVTLVFASAWLAVTQWAEAHRFGLLHMLTLPPVAGAALAVLLLDAWTYAWHRLNHRVQSLWRFHRFHHSDRAMDVTTASRFHTGEIVLSSALRVPVLALIGCGIEELALYEILLFSVVQFHHANIALPDRLDRWLRLIVVTPSLHKVHHSVVRAECDSNYSSLFSWWDRIFRSQRLVSDQKKIVFGLDS